MIGKRSEYDAMAACEKELWWYKCLHEQTAEIITKEQFSKNAAILDAGCGTGGMLLFLQEQGFTNLHGFDLSPDAVEYAHEITGLPIQQHDLTNLENCYLEKNFDVIISNDTFCMIKEPGDKIALQNLWRLVKPGGILIFNVAALTAFNGTHDISVEIEKRYNRKEVQAILPKNVQATHIIFWPFLLSPVIFSIRFVQRIQKFFQPHKIYSSDVKIPAAPINNLLYRITQFENKFITRKPWGSSLFVVIKKSTNPVVMG